MSNQVPEFDQYATHYRATLDQSLGITGESSEFFARYKAEKLASWFPDLQKQPSSILDFGCGDGLMAKWVATQMPRSAIVGVDPSPESITAAQINKLANIEFAVSTPQLAYPDNQFDLIYAAGVFHHIDRAHHQHYTQDIMRVLKPGGSFVLFELNPYNPGTRYIFKRNPIDQNAQMLSPWYAHNLLQHQGITTIKFYSFFPRQLSWLRATEPWITKVPLGGLYAYIVKKK
jgi:ubiquinone/menaquinone biosynthesis C-methylase UbiE